MREAYRAEERAWWRRNLVGWPLALATLVLVMGFGQAAWARWAALATATPLGGGHGCARASPR